MNMDSEARKWREIALYLADCHAATAEYECQMASVSKTRKQRFRNICDKAATFITRGELVGVVGRHYSETEEQHVARILGRLKEIPR